MGSTFFICTSCGAAAVTAVANKRAVLCSKCGNVIDKQDGVATHNAFPLIGLPAAGKSVYLATLHDQLMHSSPEWGVEVTDHAFGKLAEDYGRLRCGRMLSPTAPGSERHFLMTVVWRGCHLPLIMSDLPGETCHNLKRIDEDPVLPFLLFNCRALMVALNCPSMVDPSAFGGLPLQDADASLGAVFHYILKKSRFLRRVVVVLVGADIYSTDPTEASHRAVQVFDSAYRLFPGVLRNRKVPVEVVPLSNFGLGNRLNMDTGLLTLPLSPYNVLEPLRRAIPFYQPLWSRISSAFGARLRPPVSVEGDVNSTEVTAQPKRVPVGRVFMSYRREGGAETARLIRRELASRGWAVFLDVDDLGSSYFDQSLWLEIDKADNVVLVLSPGCLDRCVNRKDWFRREILHAMTAGKNIVPVMKEGFHYPDTDSLDSAIRNLPRHNGIQYSHAYFDAAMDKLVSFLRRAGEK